MASVFDIFLWALRENDKIKALTSSTPTTGQSVVAGKEDALVLSPASPLASLTITLPNAPKVGQLYRITSSQTISALTLQVGAIPAGMTIDFAPSTLTAWSVLEYLYTGANQWQYQNPLISGSSPTNTADATTITGTTSETAFSLTKTLPKLVAGKTYRAELWMRYSTPVFGGNVALKIKAGATTIIDMPAVALGSLVQTDNGMKFEGLITCRSEGASGSIATNGFLSIENGNTASQKANITSKTISTTAPQTLSATITPSQTASSVTLEQFILYPIN